MTGPTASSDPTGAQPAPAPPEPGAFAATRTDQSAPVPTEPQALAAAAATVTAPLLLPIGYYYGAFFPAVGAELKHYRLRVGPNPVSLSEDQFAIWSLAHGLPERLQAGPWSRASLEELATELEVPNTAAVLDSLLADGLVAEIDLDSPTAQTFAQSHVVQPLMIGLGNTPDYLGLYHLGLFGQPVVRVTRATFEP